MRISPIPAAVWNTQARSGLPRRSHRFCQAGPGGGQQRDARRTGAVRGAWSSTDRWTTSTAVWSSWARTPGSSLAEPRRGLSVGAP